MSIDLVALAKILLLMSPSAILFSVCMDVVIADGLALQVSCAWGILFWHSKIMLQVLSMLLMTLSCG